MPPFAFGKLGLWGGWFLASFFASWLPMVVGRALWPSGLSAGTDTLFWPASAVHVAALWRFGPRLWPVVFLGTFVSQLVAGRPVPSSTINALGNLAEALVFLFALRAARVGERPLHSPRGVLVFLSVALLAPLCSSLPGAATLWAQGRLPGAEYLPAVGVWTLANATSIVLLAPVLLLVGAPWHGGRRKLELALWLLFGAVAGWFAFHAVFRASGGVNHAFLVFPFVLCAALRFGLAETAGALLWVMALMYVSLVVHAPLVEPGRVTSTLWFLQTYGFVLGASGLLLSALTASRAEAEARLRAERALLRESAEREERARLEALRYQIHPHFLFNSLNSIRAVACDASREMLTELSDYLRSTLDRSDADRAPLREEIRCARGYLAVERLRHGEELRADFDIEEAALERPVPVFLLQPLVENAVRHGFERSREPFRLLVSARVVAGFLRIDVANTGLWRTDDRREGAGLGMENVRRRLALVHGDDAVLRVQREPGWVRVRIEIPQAPAG